VLLELLQITSKSTENVYFLLLLDSWMLHFYEIPAEMIKQTQQILVKTTGTQLDGFALKTLDQSTSYHSFYTSLVEQLDFTRLTGGRVKAYYNLLWRILGYLFHRRWNISVKHRRAQAVRVCCIHFNWRRRFLVDEATLSNFSRFTHLSKKEEIYQLYRIVLDQFQSSLKFDPYLRALAMIAIFKPSEETTTNVTRPTKFEQLLKFQLKTFFEQKDLRLMCLQE
jgi:hypothetical protein